MVRSMAEVGYEWQRVAARIEAQIASLTAQRDVLAGTIRSALDDVEFNNGHLDGSQVHDWLAQAQKLLDQAHGLAAGS